MQSLDQVHALASDTLLHVLNNASPASASSAQTYMQSTNGYF